MANGVIKQKRSKAFDVKVITSHDLNSIFRGMRDRRIIDPEASKGLAKALLICEQQAQRNITRMKAVLSGWMRNQFVRTIYRASQNQINGILWNKAWYARMVHEGIGIHSSGGGKFMGPGTTPQNIVELQKQLLSKRRRPAKKGPRRFMLEAYEEKKGQMIDVISEGIGKGVKKLLLNYKRRTVRRLSK